MVQWTVWRWGQLTGVGSFLLPYWSLESNWVLSPDGQHLHAPSRLTVLDRASFHTASPFPSLVKLAPMATVLNLPPRCFLADCSLTPSKVHFPANNQPWSLD